MSLLESIRGKKEPTDGENQANPMIESLFKQVSLLAAEATRWKCRALAMELEVRHSNRGAMRKAFGIKKLLEKLEKYKLWVADLQKGMYVNCIFCGYRYGPSESTPASRAEILKDHVEVCPEHPIAKLKKENEYLRKELGSGHNCLEVHDVED